MVLRSFYTLLFGLTLMLSSSIASAQTDVMQGNSTYKLSSGDIIRILVYGEPDLSVDQTRLTDAGTFSYPFVG